MKYKILKPLFDFKVGQIVADVNGHKEYEWLDVTDVEIDIYTRLGVLEEYDGKWKPEVNSDYFCVNNWGGVSSSTWSGEAADRFALSQNNVHRTREEAEAHKQKLLDNAKEV